MQIISYHDADGKSGLEYILCVISQLLSPSSAEMTAAFVGKLITVIIRKVPDHLGNALDQLLRGVLSKLQVRD